MLSTDTYGYGNANWGDLLTSYNGQSIAYDNIGNPSSWRNVSDLIWQGRELSSFWDVGFNTEHQYKYNVNGIRTSKHFEYWVDGGSTDVSYVVDGSKILKETRTGNQNATLYYFYDSDGSVIGFSLDGNTYYYGKNIQGDVIYVYNASGAVVTEYCYDAWGNILSITGSLASTVGAINPFRYRGYYYDSETGFYYLQSRYYDPTVGRFINADAPELAAQAELLGTNLYAYCENNPVINVDPTGFFYNNN